jgi:hypothetical protein
MGLNEHSNETWGSVKFQEFLDSPRKYYCLKNDSAVWSGLVGWFGWLVGRSVN